MKTYRRSQLSGRVIGCAIAVHSELGPGYLESVYAKALALELANRRINFQLQKKLIVNYRNVPVGEFMADLLVEDEIVVELKAVSALNRAHEAQLLHYLKCTGKTLGLLLNFGSASLQIRRRVHEQVRSASTGLSA